jgi:hypothetical protein
MSESIWWPDEAWWERKVLPLGFITLSFRQLVTVVLSFLVAFVVSFPFEFPIAGFSFGGRAAAFCMVFGVGYVISSRRVKLLPAELQAFYFLRTNGVDTARMKLRQLLGRKEPEKVSTTVTGQLPIIQELTVDDFRNPLPLVVSDRVNGVQNETKVQLFLDDQPRGEDLVSPQKPRYRLLYLPLPEDIGSRRLSVKLEGTSEPLVAISLTLKGRSPETNESITRVR